MPRLCSHSLTRPACLTTRYCGWSSRSSITGHGESFFHHHHRRFHSHDAALAEVGLGADGYGAAGATSRGLHARRLRARDASKVKVGHKKPVVTEHGSGEGLVARSAVKPRSERRRRRSPATTHGKADHWYDMLKRMAASRRFSNAQIDDEASQLWEDAHDANVLQLGTLLAAQRVATNAEIAKKRAEVASEASIKDEAIRLQSRARKLANLVAQRKDAMEEARITARVASEAHPVIGKDTYGGKVIRGRLRQRCRICLMPHSPTSCPFLFEDPKDRTRGFTPNDSLATLGLFQTRWEADAGFREALTYLRATFSRAPGSELILPLYQRETRDAPLSAIRECPPTVTWRRNRRPNAFVQASNVDTAAKPSSRSSTVYSGPNPSSVTQRRSLISGEDYPSWEVTTVPRTMTVSLL